MPNKVLSNKHHCKHLVCLPMRTVGEEVGGVSSHVVTACRNWNKDTMALSGDDFCTVQKVRWKQGCKFSLCTKGCELGHNNHALYQNTLEVIESSLRLTEFEQPD